MLRQRIKLLFFNKVFLISIVIALFSALLRFWQLSERFTWAGVEGSFIWDIWYVAQGHFSLIGFESAAIGGLNFPPFLLYFLLVPFWIFAGNPIYIGITLALLGVLTSVLFFLIGREIFGFKVGLVAAILHTFSFQTIAVDHKFIGGTFMVPISLIVIYLIWKIQNAKGLLTRDLMILGSVLGLAFSAHYQAIFLVAGVVLFLLLYKRQFLNIKNTLLFLASILVWLSTLAMFDLRHNFYHLRGFLTLLTGYTQTQGQSGFLVSGQYFLQNITGIFWYPAYFIQFSKLGVVGVGFIILSIFVLAYFLVKNFANFVKTGPIFVYFATLFILGLIILSFYRTADYQFDYYYWYLIPPAILTAGAILAEISQKQPLLSIFLLILFCGVNFTDFAVNFHSVSWRPRKMYGVTYNVADKTVQSLLENAKSRNLSRITVKFKGAEVGTYDYLFYYYTQKLNINPKSLVLVSPREEYQERSILGSGASPIKILTKGAGDSLKENYLITEGGFEVL